MKNQNTIPVDKNSPEGAFLAQWGWTVDETFTKIQEIFKTFPNGAAGFSDDLYCCFEYVLYSLNHDYLDTWDLVRANRVFMAIAELTALTFDMRQTDTKWIDDLPGVKANSPIALVNTAFHTLLSFAGGDKIKKDYALIYAHVLCPEACKELTNKERGDLAFMCRLMVNAFTVIEKALPAIAKYSASKSTLTIKKAA